MEHRRAALVLVLSCVCFSAAMAWPVSRNPAAVRAMSGGVLSRAELYPIYAGKTWHWKDGAAYFAEPGQKFEAWLRKADEPSYADGSWSVSDNGQLCIRATWHSPKQSTDTFTCYVHRRSNAIYPQELPAGQWYLFGHIPAQPGDEIEKITPGDEVSAEYLKIRNAMTPPKPARNKRRARHVAPKH